jgi:uncharacterized damage-inducible protein DinB
MHSLDQIRALFEYNEWANGHVLDAAARLDEESLARKLGASFDSIQGNLAHAVGAQNIWLSRWANRPMPAPPAPEAGRVIDALRAAYDASHAGLREFLASLDEEDLERSFDYVDTQGNAQSRVLWQTMLHVVNHGTHHRAETAMMLTMLGAAPRQLDYVFYELERAGGPPRLR